MILWPELASLTRDSLCPRQNIGKRPSKVDTWCCACFRLFVISAVGRKGHITKAQMVKSTASLLLILCLVQAGLTYLSTTRFLGQKEGQPAMGTLWLLALPLADAWAGSYLLPSLNQFWKIERFHIQQIWKGKKQPWIWGSHVCSANSDRRHAQRLWNLGWDNASVSITHDLQARGPDLILRDHPHDSSAEELGTNRWTMSLPWWVLSQWERDPASKHTVGRVVRKSA